jgi:hypothetical protein
MTLSNETRKVRKCTPAKVFSIPSLAEGEGREVLGSATKKA